MDRSFLSQADVINASRDFVCIRLTTYENQSEHEFMESIGGAGRSGEIENTVFTFLAPDGKTRLTRVGRSARFLFSDAKEMAASMRELAARHPPGRESREDVPELPKVASPRLALNVAASDSLPLVVIYAKDVAARAKLEEYVRRLAWSDEFLGRFTYVITGSGKDLAAVKNAGEQEGLLVVSPDKYGQSGELLATVPAQASRSEVAGTMRAALATFKPPLKLLSHVRDGRRLGVFWETELPVTDPMEAAARERGKQLKARP